MSHSSPSGSCARLELVVSFAASPLIQRHCPGCKAARSFASSGRFRVNAQKKQIDIWLIWRCAVCGQTWNQPIHERRAVRSLPPAEFEAFMRNDAVLARHHAGLLAAQAGVAAEGIQVMQRIIHPPASDCTHLEIVITVPPGNPMRLDRILASGLKLGRGEVVVLAEGGALLLDAAPKALRRPAASQVVVIDLARCAADVAARCLAAAAPDMDG